MLFRKDVPHCCDLCANGIKLEENSYLCTKRGNTEYRESCRRFTYDPCKRTPSKKKAMDFSQFDENDYSL